MVEAADGPCQCLVALAGQRHGRGEPTTRAGPVRRSDVRPDATGLRRRPCQTCRERCRPGRGGGGAFPRGQSGRPGSNRRPSAWEADALPTELRPRGGQSTERAGQNQACGGGARGPPKKSGGPASLAGPPLRHSIFLRLQNLVAVAVDLLIRIEYDLDGRTASGRRLRGLRTRQRDLLGLAADRVAGGVVEKELHAHL